MRLSFKQVKYMFHNSFRLGSSSERDFPANIFADWRDEVHPSAAFQNAEPLAAPGFNLSVPVKFKPDTIALRPVWPRVTSSTAVRLAADWARSIPAGAKAKAPAAKVER
jgi:hypothetical protein